MEGSLTQNLLSVFGRLAKNKANIQITTKNDFIIQGDLENIDENFNLLLYNVNIFINGSNRNYKSFLVRGSSVKHFAFSADAFNPKVIEVAWKQLVL